MLYTSVHGNPSHSSIVFLHGGGGAGWMWQPQVQALEKDYHLLVPDLPEQGRSADIKPFSIAGSAALAAERSHSAPRPRVTSIKAAKRITVHSRIRGQRRLRR